MKEHTVCTGRVFSTLYFDLCVAQAGLGFVKILLPSDKFWDCRHVLLHRCMYLFIYLVILR